MINQKSFFTTTIWNVRLYISSISFNSGWISSSSWTYTQKPGNLWEIGVMKAETEEGTVKFHIGRCQFVILTVASQPQCNSLSPFAVLPIMTPSFAHDKFPLSPNNHPPWFVQMRTEKCKTPAWFLSLCPLPSSVGLTFFAQKRARFTQTGWLETWNMGP